MKPLQSPSNSRPKQSIRAKIACQSCRERKKRCDGQMHGFPCTNCRLDERICRKPMRKKRGKAHGIYCAVFYKGQGTEHEATLDPQQTTGNCNSELFVPYPELPFLRIGYKSQLSTATLESVESKGASLLPARQTLEAFIEAYFLYVHPYLPMVDEDQFWDFYRHPEENNGAWPLLLFQAMIYASTNFVSDEILRQCGFDSSITIRESYYRRVETLFNNCVENDPFTLSQTALLMTWYSPLSATDTEWMAIAVRHAKAANAHLFHKIDHPFNHDKLALKRLWWSCLIRDRMLSLIMCRSLHISPSEFDLSQPFLGPEDMDADESRWHVRSPSTEIPVWPFLTSLCQLVAVMADVVSVIYPSPLKPDHDNPANPPKQMAPNIQNVERSLAIWEQTHGSIYSLNDETLSPSHALFKQLSKMYCLLARNSLCHHVCQNPFMFSSLSFQHYERYRAISWETTTDIENNIMSLISLQRAGILPTTVVAYTIIPFLFRCIDRKYLASEDRESLVTDSDTLRVDDQNDSIWIQHAIGLSGVNFQGSPKPAAMPIQSPFGIANQKTAYNQIVQYLKDLTVKFERNGQCTESLFNDIALEISDFWDPSPTVSANWLNSMETFFFG